MFSRSEAQTTPQLQRALSGIRCRSHGVYPADRIPIRIPTPASVVVNTDPHNKPGTHWVAFYINREGRCEYFDSYGLEPFILHHLHAIRANSKTMIWNTKPIQSMKSQLCGQYCVMFLYYKSRGYTMRQFQEMFTNDYLKNDQLARKFYKRFKNYASAKYHCIQSCRAYV